MPSILACLKSNTLNTNLGQFLISFSLDMILFFKETGWTLEKEEGQPGSWRADGPLTPVWVSPSRPPQLSSSQQVWCVLGPLETLLNQ